MINYYLNDYQGAISDFTRVIEIDPSHAEAYYKRGLVKYLMKLQVFVVI